MVRIRPKHRLSTTRHEADIAALLQVMQRDVLQHLSFFQSLIDGAGIRNVNEGSTRIRSVIDPILVPPNNR
jgi:hypothetical protein